MSNFDIKGEIFPFEDKKYLIEKIIENRALEIYFQPIISIRSNRIYAFEALTRCTYKEQNIPPFILFELAKEHNLALELDKLTRKMSIEKFKDYYEKNKSLQLFLNFESTLIDEFDSNCKKNYEFVEIIDNLNIPYKNFIIEVKEDEIRNTNALKDFCKTFKEKGFFVALDDFGTGNSTFDRINVIKPDLIKLDRSLFKNIEENHINKEIVKAITEMSNNLGIRVLAEGVEESSSILRSLKYGINLFQGYYFSKPIKDLEDAQIYDILEKILNIGDEFKKKTIENIHKKRESIRLYNLISLEIIDNLKDLKSDMNLFKNKNDKSNFIEALYLIDSKTSAQIGDTVLIEPENHRFSPTRDGDEHFLKEYFYITNESREGIYLSQKYISYATGNLCKTFAKKFSFVDGNDYILCIDIICSRKI